MDLFIYGLRYGPRARSELNGLDEEQRARIHEQLTLLESDPRPGPPKVTPLVGGNSIYRCNEIISHYVMIEGERIPIHVSVSYHVNEYRKRVTILEIKSLEDTESRGLSGLLST